MTTEGLIYGYYLSGDKKGQPISATEVNQTNLLNEPVWLHFDYTHPMTQQWLRAQSQLEEFVVEALLEEETRPRAHILDDGVLASLRGINLTKGAAPEDMVAIRFWSNGQSVISSRKRAMYSAQDIAELIAKKKGPESAGELVAMLTERLIFRMQESVSQIEEAVAEVEEKVLVESTYSLRSEIADLRRQIVSLRRYLAPQKEAMVQLQNPAIRWINESDRREIRETNDTLIRYIEDLDMAREHAAVTQEELNNRMYVLSIVAAIFLPLGFLTGLLGINVGGIPGSEDPTAFWVFLLMLVLVVALQVWIFKIKKWF